jgi:hypothetical protein
MLLLGFTLEACVGVRGSYLLNQEPVRDLEKGARGLLLIAPTRNAYFEHLFHHIGVFRLFMGKTARKDFQQICFW